ncbi:hypothetical protein GGH94_002735 [Coemansia aciculifera]|uniref:RING-type E3 ubiquitin transferase n=1 Tax=Coemansia aciculifera TaxID=417176 RepID=A0A9W8IIC1_9FUNG|nr:hypothetical protein GGH94_002735 [Coemansia aciculifera]
MDTPVFAVDQSTSAATNARTTAAGLNRNQASTPKGANRGRSTKQTLRSRKDVGRGGNSNSSGGNRGDTHANGPADTSKEAEEEEEEDVCFICADPVEFYAVGACNHRTCFRCNMRLRALFKSKACPYCKSEMESVIYTRNAEATYDDLSKDSLPFSDEGLSIKFDCEEAYTKSMYMLQFNCPRDKCQYVDGGGWKGLKAHVDNDHTLQFCDICVKNKMSFSHEHRLYTKAQLRAHYSRGDGTGFTGHPQCDFCRIYFYDNDQLFDHCRQKHEQCFICVRNGTGRHVYFADYPALEKHFNNDHIPCRHAFCLEKKFVVFENDIDLQSHELEVHGSSIVGQRARREAKQVSVNVQYATNRGTVNSSATASGSRSTAGAGRNRPGDTSQRPSTMTVNGPDAAGVSIAGRQRPAGFGRVSDDGPRPGTRAREVRSSAASTPANSSPEPEPKSLWPTLGPDSRSRLQNSHEASASGSRAHDRAPLNFGRMSETPTAGPDDVDQSVADEETLASHQELLQRVSAYVSHREQPVARFRQLTTQFKNGGASAEEYVQNCWLLFLTVPGKNAKVMIQNTIKSVAELLPEAGLKSDLLKALNEHRIRQQQFPALTPLVSPSERAAPASDNASRVLVIKKAPPSSRASSGWSTPPPATSKSHATRSNGVQLDQDPKRSYSSGSHSSAAFPSLGSSGVPTVTTLASQLRIGATAANSSRNLHSASTPARTPLSVGPRTVAPEFPDLPAAAVTRPPIIPIDRNAISAWDGTGVGSSDNSNRQLRSSKQSRNSKGKQVLFRAG